MKTNTKTNNSGEVHKRNNSIEYTHSNSGEVPNNNSISQPETTESKKQ